MRNLLYVLLLSSTILEEQWSHYCKLIPKDRSDTERKGITYHSPLKKIHVIIIFIEKVLTKRHWLDTNRDKYYEILEQVVIPECMSIASNIPGYPERIQKLFSHCYPAFSDTWNFNVELIYRMVANQEHKTEENITKVYLLRALMDLSFSMSAVLDDLSDKSDYRLGKKAWHTICQGGEGAAIYDGAQMALLPIFILMKHFRNDPGYVRMMELVSMGNLELMIGQTIDVLGQSNGAPSMDSCRHIIYYKAGQFVSIGPCLALLHAGVTSEELICETKAIFTTMGQLIQIWDDFNDYYSNVEQTGKPPCDMQNAGTTWVSAIAMEKFTPSQKEEFKKCYGSSDPIKRERVYKLYNEIDMPKLYVEYMIHNYSICKEMINQLPQQNLRESCHSYLEWLVGQDSPTGIILDYE